MTLHDVEATSTRDLATQYYLTAEDVGTNRATACYNKLSELNNYVPLSTCTEELNDSIITKYRVVVLTG